ncbi:MAG: D-amino acid dehydrogenase [Gammaproteobacteria bacterium]|nr:D-amino acid dehydrogenase [Gammaproteobacteria bacterium]
MKIIVIGAGLLGLCSAHYLAGRGAQVTVVDRRAGPGLETSFANAGMVTPSQAEPWNEPGIMGKLTHWLGREDAPVLVRPAALGSLMWWGMRFLRNSTAARFHANAVANVRLAAYSLACLRELRRSEALDYGQICSGTVKIYRDPAAMEEGMALARMLAAEGVEPGILDPSGVVALEPALADVADGLAGAIHFPGDESGDAFRFCRALAESLQRRGVEFRMGAEVLGFTLHGDRAIALRTRTGPAQADAFVVCAGCLSPRLGAGLGAKLPIQPVKGYSITVPMAGGIRPGLPVVDDAMHIALTPMDGRLRVAGTAEFAGFDTRLRPERIQNLIAATARIYPRHAPHPGADVCAWAGLRPYTCDGVPIIGRTRVDNVFLNTGHGHLGWTLAAGSGKLLSQLMTGATPELSALPYRPSRF